MKPSEEILMAYADGELDDAGRGQVEAAMAGDPAIARRIAEFRSQREHLRTAFDRVLSEPVPLHLIAAVQGVQRIRPVRRWSWPEFGAMAASVIFGAVFSWAVLQSGNEPMIAATDQGLIARGLLAQSLSEHLAGDPGAGGVQIGLSFRDRSGAYCRTFALRESSGLTGLACRAEQGWELHILSRGGGRDDATYRMAGASMPPEIMRAVQERIAGNPLDADAEESAKASGWRQ